MQMTSPPPVEKERAAVGARGARDVRDGVRTCVGCQARFSAGKDARTPADLHVRVVLGPAASAGAAPELAVDFAGSSFGRGAHVHVRPACLERACRAGFAKAWKRPVSASPSELARQIVQAADQRIRGLLQGARRAKLVAIGDDARERLSRGEGALAVVAVDAGASATKGALASLVREGKVVAFGTKAELGALFGREEVAVVAITNPGVATEIHCARAAADAVTALAKS